MRWKLRQVKLFIMGLWETSVLIVLQGPCSTFVLSNPRTFPQVMRMKKGEVLAFYRTILEQDSGTYCNSKLNKQPKCIR